MRKITAIVILCLLPSLSNSAQETKEISKNSNSSSTEDYTKFRFGGYGEMVANFKDYGINRFYGGNDGNPKKNRNTISIPRFVLAFDYKFNSKWILGAEIEFESGGTGTAFELENTENGEYETEEGCLSLDGERKTKRYKTVTVKYANDKFKTVTRTFTNFTAQIIQHEIDHCNGILI